MKKIVSTIVMIVFFTCNPAHAFVPLAIPAVAIGAGALVGAAINLAGLYFFMKPGSSGSVNASGDIKRPSGAVWIDLKDVNPVKEKDITASMSHSKAVELAQKKDINNNLLYPTVESALFGSGSGPMTKNSSIGNTYNTNVGYGKVTAVRGPVTNTGQSSQNCTAVRWTATTATFAGASVGGGLCTEGTKITFTSVGPPPKQEYPLATANGNLTGLGYPGANGGTVASNYQSELDKMFQDPDYVPVFSDDTTGLPFSPPSNVATPAQVASYNANGVAQEAKETASTSSQSAASSAGTAATTAANNYAASGGDPQTGVGGDPVLLQKMRDAQASAAVAQAALDKLKADQAVDDAEELASVAPGLPGDNVYDPSVDSPDKKNITELLTSFAAGSPLISMVQSFTVTTSDSSGVVPIGNIYGQELSFDFTRWESILRTCGGFLILIMHGYAVLIVVRGW